MKTYPVNGYERNDVEFYKQYVAKRIERADNEQKNRFQTEYQKVLTVLRDTFNNRGGKMVAYVNDNQYRYWKAVVEWTKVHHIEIAKELGLWTDADEKRQQKLAEIRAKHAVKKAA